MVLLRTMSRWQSFCCCPRIIGVKYWVVEAKTSSPRPETQPHFDGFIADVSEKSINAFSLGWASCLGRHKLAETELPSDFNQLDLSKADVKFVLDINGHKDEWLPPISDALKIALRSTVKCGAFKPDSVAVINDDMALEYNLISAAHH